jgi:ApbE superfamily uncharacterized protein (UPF0280 family)
MRKFRSHFCIGEASFTIVSDLNEATIKGQQIAREIYTEVEMFVINNPIFRDSFEPTNFAVKDLQMPRVARIMEEVTAPFGIGPMAAVAGAIADIIFERLQSLDPRMLLVEDGGEIIVKSTEPVTVGLYTGLTALGGDVGFEIDPLDMPIGIATSSATVSHAISLGEADAATIFAKSGAVADAAATFFCNNVKGKDIPRSIQQALALLPSFEECGVHGVFIVRESHVGTAGKVPRLIKIKNQSADIITRKEMCSEVSRQKKW